MDVKQKDALALEKYSAARASWLGVLIAQSCGINANIRWLLTWVIVDIRHHRQELAEVTVEFWTEVQGKQTDEFVRLLSNVTSIIFHLGQRGLVQVQQCSKLLGTFADVCAQKPYLIASEFAGLANN